jgi:hypothetical protein
MAKARVPVSNSHSSSNSSRGRPVNSSNHSTGHGTNSQCLIVFIVTATVLRQQKRKQPVIVSNPGKAKCISTNVLWAAS